ncbi:MAG: hypothetical protein AAF432_04155 [Planctomycetota bacterium]
MHEFRTALIAFQDVVKTTLSGATSDVQRAIGWLEHEQVAYWERERRKWTELVARAKSDLYRKQVSSTDGRASDADERRNLAKAQERIHQVEAKIERTRQWGRQLEREYMMFRGQCGALLTAAESEMPKAVHRLDSLVEALERYLATIMPNTSSAPRDDQSSEHES